jgi:deoxyribonuclease V
MKLETVFNKEKDKLLGSAMEQAITHPWSLSESEALDLQRQMATRVERNDRLSDVHTIAGVDVAYDKHSDRLIAAAVVLDAESLTVIEQATAEDVAQFPYIPGLFSFRELPPIAKALRKLQLTPDLIVCDGQGIAHPRRFGLACHLGVLFDVPTIGCSKTRLIGEAEPPEKQRGAIAPLVDQGEIVGSVLRTQNGINPVFVSIGHRVSLSLACEWILRLSPKHRLPETTRQADQAVRAILKTL